MPSRVSVKVSGWTFHTQRHPCRLRQGGRRTAIGEKRRFFRFGIRIGRAIAAPQPQHGCSECLRRRKIGRQFRNGHLPQAKIGAVGAASNPVSILPCGNLPQALCVITGRVYVASPFHSRQSRFFDDPTDFLNAPVTKGYGDQSGSPHMFPLPFSSILYKTVKIVKHLYPVSAFGSGKTILSLFVPKRRMRPPLSPIRARVHFLRRNCCFCGNDVLY